MKKISLYLMEVFISLSLCLACAFFLSAWTPISFEALILAIATVFLMIAFLDFTKTQHGIMVGVGNQQNPLSSSVIASLNTNVETTERSLDMNRINNTLHSSNKFVQLIFKRTTIQMIFIGLALLSLAFTLYFYNDASGSPTDQLCYDGGYKMKGLEWSTSLDDFSFYSDYSTSEVMTDADGTTNIHPMGTASITYKNMVFEPTYTFTEELLVAGSYTGRTDNLTDYITVTESLLKVVTNDLPKTFFGSLEVLKSTPEAGDGPKDLMWVGADGSHMILSVQNNTDIRQDPHYIIRFDVTAP